MFVCNFKLNGPKLAKIIFIIVVIIVILIFGIAIYNIFFKSNSENSIKSENDVLTLEDSIKADDIFEITTKNYTNVLQSTHNDLDSYIGCKIHFTGYVYRLIDFEENQFVLARDMLVSSDHNQTLVVGFLCSYDDASSFEDGAWVDVVGEITKGDYYGDIAVLKVTSINKVDAPEDLYVYPPDDTYIPTSNMF